MLLDVAIIIENLRPVSVYCFDTLTGKFREIAGKSTVSIGYLEKIDGLTMEKQGVNTCAVLGTYNEQFVVTFDYNTIYHITKAELLNYVPTNYCITANRCVRLKRGKLQDLTHLFKQDDFVIINQTTEAYSQGQQRKVVGRSKSSGKVGVIKFPLYIGSRDIDYEWLYYYIGIQVGIPVCRVERGKVGNKSCILSAFEYTELDSFSSMLSYMQTHNIATISEVAYMLNQVDLLYCCLLMDYICVQEDRHLRNFAICNARLYPLFDNGRAFGNGVIGRDSQQYRGVVERNFANWIKLYSNVKNVFKRFKALKLPANYSTEAKIVRKNIAVLEQLL